MVRLRLEGGMVCLRIEGEWCALEYRDHRVEGGWCVLE